MTRSEEKFAPEIQQLSDADYEAALNAIEEKPTPELDRAIDRCAAVLEASPKQIKQVVELFRAYGAVEVLRGKEEQLSTLTVQNLVELDKNFSQQVKAIAKDKQLAKKLAEFRSKLPKRGVKLVVEVGTFPEEIKKLNRFDWVWNSFAVLLLGFSAAFIVQNIEVYKQAEFQINELLSAVSQTGVLAWASKITLLNGLSLKEKKKEEIDNNSDEMPSEAAQFADRNTKQIDNILTSLNIPLYYQAEAKFAVSAIALLITGIFYLSLPKMGDWYYSEGNRAFENGEILTAQEKYVSALKFKKDDPDIFFKLGQAYAKLGKLQKAYENYLLASQQKENAEILNSLGFAQIMLPRWTSKDWTTKLEDTVTKEADFILSEANRKLEEKLDRNAQLKKPAYIELESELNSEILTNKGIISWAQVDLRNHPSPEVLNEALKEFKLGAILEVQSQIVKKYAAEGVILKPTEKKDVERLIVQTDTLDALNKQGEKLVGRSICYYRLARLINLAYVDKKAGEELKQADEALVTACYKYNSPIKALNLYDRYLVYKLRRLPGLPKNPAGVFIPSPES